MNLIVTEATEGIDLQRKRHRDSWRRRFPQDCTHSKPSYHMGNQRRDTYGFEPQTYLIYWGVVGRSIGTQNTRRVSCSGGEPCSSSYGVRLLSSRVGVRFIKWAAVRIDCPQKVTRRRAWKRQALATLRMWRCFLSTRPFCWGVSTEEVWWFIPSCRRYGFKTINYVPLSVQKVLTWRPNCRILMAQKFLSMDATSDFSSIRWIQKALE